MCRGGGVCRVMEARLKEHNDVINSKFGPPRNQMNFIFLESTRQELSKNTIFIYFGQVFQKLWQYKCNLTTFWHGLLPNMAMSPDSG